MAAFRAESARNFASEVFVRLLTIVRLRILQPHADHTRIIQKAGN